MRLNQNADPTTEKREAYRAADALLAKGDEDSLRYSALEMRRCMEAIVYEKLQAYGILLPEGSVHQWQPPQAFDALIEVEPNAEVSGTIFVAIQSEPTKPADGPWKKVGTDQRPTGKWIKKTWNKLGFYLHADWPFGKKSRSPLQPFIEQTLAALAPFVNNTFTMTMSMNIDFKCAGCQAQVRVMKKALEASRKATCLSCGLRHKAEEEHGSYMLYPGEEPYECECDTKSFIPARHLRVGHRFSCKGCQKEFQVFGVEWKVGPATASIDVDEDGEP
jgi:hypothetical protein